jgi:hypothetical protein
MGTGQMLMVLAMTTTRLPNGRLLAGLDPPDWSSSVTR